eukprot:TRINITY_DN12947_c0_g1_i1.p1 TRINITY_DN12947_c0_g1~~TRINITY_DN12947_c0_g1_i1.p1  ORF type:complete len:568 (-),score=119.76 TRINITY_DN12947_c0_g1_i1:8-1711(-)
MSHENERMVLYQVMTRLFSNTNTSNIHYGTASTNGCGKFNDITRTALESIKSMGYTHIWYTGVIEHSVVRDYSRYGIPLDHASVVKGRAGSPYAIKNYYNVNPDLAVSVEERMKEYEDLLERTHKAGLKVIMDFVPNHVGRVYYSDEDVIGLGDDDNADVHFDANNNFYYFPNQSFKAPHDYKPLGSGVDTVYEEYPAKATGNDAFTATPSINDWFETVKVNYGVDYLDWRRTYFDPIPDTWNKMRDILLFWSAKGVDGFRCDMAEMVPVEFWNWVVPQIKSEFPHIKMIAESYDPGNYRNYLDYGGFDYLYDKVDLYDTLKAIIQGHANTDSLTNIWQKLDGIYDRMLRFLENHDEQRIASRFFAGDMWKGIPMMAATSFMHSGPVMMYFGQEVGEPAEGSVGFSGDDGRTSIFDYCSVPEHIKWVNNGSYDGALLNEDQRKLREKYIEILLLCNQSEAIREGHFYDLHYFNRNWEYTGYSDKVYTFLRHSGAEIVLVIINFAEWEENARVKIPENAWELIGITKEDVNIGNYGAIKRSSTTSYALESDINIVIPPLDYRVLEIKK